MNSKAPNQLKSLASALLKHGAIVTTAAKAKALRAQIEPLITQSKGTVDLHRRRQLLSRLLDKSDLARLLDVARAHEKRGGGYVRLTKLPKTRTDAAAEMRVEIIDHGDQA